MPNSSSLESQVSPQRTALIVVDMQNDFIADEGFMGGLGADVAAAQKLVGRVNAFVEVARAHAVHVMFLQEVFAERTSQPNLVAKWGRWDVAIAEGPWGAELHPELITPATDEPVITKWNYDGFSDT